MLRKFIGESGCSYAENGRLDIDKRTVSKLRSLGTDRVTLMRRKKKALIAFGQPGAKSVTQAQNAGYDPTMRLAGKSRRAQSGWDGVRECADSSSQPGPPNQEEVM
jgi:hypothetical protein